MVKLLSIVAVVLGALLLIGAGIVRWGVAPAKAVLPSDTNTTRTYTGTATTLFNPAALTGGAGSVLATNVPITVTHQDRVLQTNGSNALVNDTRTVTAAGAPVASVQYRYAINRTNLGAGSGFADTVEQQGLTFNWPVRTEPHDYTGWVSDTHRPVTLHYAGTTTRGGVSVDRFTVSTKPALITDAQVLTGLPTSLPKAQVVALAPKLGLSAAQLAQLAAVAPTLPDPVPFTYAYQVTATYYVAPKSGIVVDLNAHEVRTLTLTVGTATVPVSPVLDITFTSTPATLAAAAADARDKGDAITVLYSTLPEGMAWAGGVLLLAGLAGLVIRRRPTASGPQGAHEAITPITTAS